jgi:XapX domain-containing protein
MRALFVSFAVGLGVGVLYGLLRVKSPAPPIVALLGLLGMVIGEQVGTWLHTTKLDVSQAASVSLLGEIHGRAHFRERRPTPWLWLGLTERDDGLCGIAGQLLRYGRNTKARVMGQTPNLELAKQTTPHLTTTSAAGAFTAGAFIDETKPSRSITYATAIATYKF